jgi:hypothetical protein
MVCFTHPTGRKPRLRIPGGPPEIRVGPHFPGTISRRISMVKERDFTRSPGPPSCPNEVAGITPIVEELREPGRHDGHDACSRVARRFDRFRRANAAAPAEDGTTSPTGMLGPRGPRSNRAERAVMPPRGTQVHEHGRVDAKPDGKPGTVIGSQRPPRRPKPTPAAPTEATVVGLVPALPEDAVGGAARCPPSPTGTELVIRPKPRSCRFVGGCRMTRSPGKGAPRVPVMSMSWMAGVAPPLQESLWALGHAPSEPNDPRADRTQRPSRRTNPTPGAPNEPNARRAERTQRSSRRTKPRLSGWIRICGRTRSEGLLGALSRRPKPISRADRSHDHADSSEIAAGRGRRGRIEGIPDSPKAVGHAPSEPKPGASNEPSCRRGTRDLGDRGVDADQEGEPGIPLGTLQPDRRCHGSRARMRSTAA